MSYAVDLYRDKVDACDDFVDFGLYVAYFPQLVTGPIERASRLLPALRKARTFDIDQFSRGIGLILSGLVKKVDVADGVAALVSDVFSHEHPSGVEVAVGLVCFAVQIYGDFSGYSDIVRGVSKLLGIELMTNFRQPYFSPNPSEFWRRWHISLSSWLRDYLYIPLGGNRNGPRNTYRNLMLTMLLGGLWHGAAWNFVLWGAFQGGLLGIHRWLVGAAPESRPNNRWASPLKMLLFFAVTCYGWLLFRARSFEQIASMTSALFDTTSLAFRLGTPRLGAVVGILTLVPLEIAQFRSDEAAVYWRWPTFARGAFFAALIVALLLGLDNAPETFIYFQF